MPYRRKSPEAEIQRAVFAHLRQRGAPGIFAFHVPNGGYRKPIEAAILKGMGARAGVPDVIIIKPVTMAALLVGQVYALELKADKGSASEKQRECIAALRRAGAIADVVYGLDASLAWLERHGLLLGRMR